MKTTVLGAAVAALSSCLLVTRAGSAVLPFIRRASSTTKEPHFVGQVVTEWCCAKDQNCCKKHLEENVPQREKHDCTRDMKLVQSFSFVDVNGTAWTAPKDFVIDGATIPKPLWIAFGSPYTGKYRRASVIHDYYCVKKNRSLASKQDVHRMFYEAMLCDGVDKTKAWTVWRGVCLGWAFTKWD